MVLVLILTDGELSVSHFPLSIINDVSIISLPCMAVKISQDPSTIRVRQA